MYYISSKMDYGKLVVEGILSPLIHLAMNAYRLRLCLHIESDTFLLLSRQKLE